MHINQLFDTFPEIETTRLYLKSITVSDADSLYEICNDPEIVKRISY